MITTFTRNDVLRFIYNEVSTEEKREIEIALTKDHELMDYYIETSQTVDALKVVKMQPSDRIIENILKYSSSFNLK